MPNKTIHAHVIDQTVTADARTGKKRELSMAWLDFSKAFDSISHAYVRHILRATKIEPKTVDLIVSLMKGWSVQYEITKNGEIQKSTPLNIKNGLPQGDAMSPIIFCLVTSVIPYALSTHIPYYETSTGSVRGKNAGNSLSLNCLIYMDDQTVCNQCSLARRSHKNRERSRRRYRPETQCTKMRHSTREPKTTSGHRRERNTRH